MSWRSWRRTWTGLGSSIPASHTVRQCMISRGTHQSPQGLETWWGVLYWTITYMFFVASVDWRYTDVLVPLEKTVSEAVGDWYFGNQAVVVREVDSEYPCNPTCTQLPTIARPNLQWRWSGWIGFNWQMEEIGKCNFWSWKTILKYSMEQHWIATKYANAMLCASDCRAYARAIRK